MTRRSCAILWAVFALLFSGSLAAVIQQASGRFDPLVIQDPSSRLGIVAEDPTRTTGLDALGAGWNAFRQSHGADWRIWLDRRSGSPTLVEGPGIRWFAPGSQVGPIELETAARQFVAANEPLFGVKGSELVWDPQGSGAVDLDHWVLVFDRVVAGVPVEGEQFLLRVTWNNMVSFGATRWGIASVPQAVYDSAAALQLLRAYMGLRPEESYELVEDGHRVMIPSAPSGDASPRYTGPAGLGIDHRLAWRFALRVTGEPGTWVGKVDAVSGKVIAFYDADLYGVKGGVYPLSNDQNCADLGCEQAGFPMPTTNVTLAKKLVTTDDMGQFTCGKGPKNSSVKLSGPYVSVSDLCGTAQESGNCSNDLDFGASTGTDCTVPSGEGVGDTHAGRTSYYVLDRLKEKARYWQSLGVDGFTSAVGSPLTSVTAHPVCFAGHVHYLTRHVGELGTLPLEQAIRKMTSMPAAHFGLRDRGLVRAGYAADLVVLDRDPWLDLEAQVVATMVAGRWVHNPPPWD